MVSRLCRYMFCKFILFEYGGQFRYIRLMWNHQSMRRQKSKFRDSQARSTVKIYCIYINRNLRARRFAAFYVLRRVRNSRVTFHRDAPIGNRYPSRIDAFPCLTDRTDMTSHVGRPVPRCVSGNTGSAILNGMARLYSAWWRRHVSFNADVTLVLRCVGTRVRFNDDRDAGRLFPCSTRWRRWRRSTRR